MITVQNTVNAPIDKVWEIWTTPKYIMKWNIPSADWHNPYAENDLKVGGKFKFVMAAKDESVAFDFEGIYTKIEKFSLIEYRLYDNRTASICFEIIDDKVKITEKFEPQKEDSESMQEEWCQAVIDNFKKYVEANDNSNY